MSEIDIFVEKLAAYRQGGRTIEEVGEEFAKLDRFSHFNQFIKDGAIRADDVEYSVMQEKALAKFLRLLREKSYDEAEQITFLSTP